MNWNVLFVFYLLPLLHYMVINFWKRIIRSEKKKQAAKGAHALDRSHHKTHKLNSDPTLIKVKAVWSKPTLTVQTKSNGSHHACLLMSHWICVTRTHSHSLSLFLSLLCNSRRCSNPNTVVSSPSTTVWGRISFSPIILPWNWKIRESISRQLLVIYLS